MTIDDDRVRLSRRLSYVLRHHPELVHVDLDPHGWTAIDELVAALNRSDSRSPVVTRDAIADVVRTSDKRRFEIANDRIRAAQGHSVPIDLDLEATEPPAILFHGTVDRFLDSIRSIGLTPGSRNHVHLSADVATATTVGSRRGRPVVFTIDAAAMHRDGARFYLASNGVWLTEDVPPWFISFPDGSGA